MKKVLSFVLILALVLGSFSFAFGLSDIEDSANTEAITVANDLGIITGYEDGSYLPEKAVNRAEFAAMITRALAIPQSALAAYSATSFKDTSGYGWAVPYLAFCESKGIMIGDGYGNVMPGRTINVNEAVTMALRAIGYTERSSALIGTWPSNYVTLAQQKGLYEDLAATVTVDRANAAQVIYNALTVTMVYVNADGETKEIEKSANVPATLLNAGLGADASTTPVLIKGDEPSKINLLKYQGAFATVYKKGGDIVAVEVESKFLVVDDALTTTTFETADDTKYTFTGTTTGYAIYENGLQTSSAAVTSFAGVVAVGDKIAVKLDGKTITKIYSVQTWKAVKTFQMDKDSLYKTKLENYQLPVTDDDAIDTSEFTLLGANSVKEIPVDAIVTVYEKGNTSGNDLIKILVSTKTVNGKVTETKGTDEVILGGNTYDVAVFSTDNLATESLSNSDMLGDSGTAYLNYFGNIAKWDVDSSTAGNYALLLATGPALDGSFDAKALRTKLLTKDGTTKVYSTDGENAVNAVVNGVSTPVAVKFGLDNSGFVSEMTTVAATTFGGQTLNKARTLLGTTKVSSDTIVFAPDSDGDWALFTIADVVTDSNALTGSAVMDGASVAKVIILNNNAMVMGADDVYGVMNSTNVAINADDKNVIRVKGFIGTDLISKLTDKANTYTKTKVLVKFKVNADGVITGAEEAKDANTTTVVAVSMKAISTGTNMISTTTGAWQAVDPNVVVYALDSDGDYYVANLAAVRNVFALYYQTDKDSAGFDYIVCLTK